MFLRTLIICCTLYAAAFTSPAWSQVEKLTVSVSHSGDDSVGSRLAFAVREAIRSSSGYQLVSEKSTLQIEVVTLDPNRGERNSGNQTVSSVTYTMRNFLPYEKGNPQTWLPIFLSVWIGLAGANRVDEQAKSILAALDREVESYKRMAREN